MTLANIGGDEKHLSMLFSLGPCAVRRDPNGTSIGANIPTSRRPPRQFALCHD